MRGRGRRSRLLRIPGRVGLLERAQDVVERVVDRRCEQRALRREQPEQVRVRDPGAPGDRLRRGAREPGLRELLHRRVDQLRAALLGGHARGHRPVCIDGWGRASGKAARVMLRVPLSLAVLLSALLALPAAAAAAETWTAADKQGFGTAHDTRSKVWFTLGRTGMDEVYWPRIDRPAVRSLELRVGGKRETAAATGQVAAADPRSLSPRRSHRARRSWRITKTYVSDPARDAVLVDLDVRSLDGRPLRLSTDLRAGLDHDHRARTALLGRRRCARSTAS